MFYICISFCLLSFWLFRTGFYGFYVLLIRIFTHINNTPGANNEIQITDAIARDIKNFIGYQFKGERFDCGSKVGYVKANIAYGLSNSELNEDLINYIKDLKNLF